MQKCLFESCRFFIFLSHHKNRTNKMRVVFISQGYRGTNGKPGMYIFCVPGGLTKHGLREFFQKKLELSPLDSEFYAIVTSMKEGDSIYLDSLSDLNSECDKGGTEFHDYSEMISFLQSSPVIN